MQLPEVFNLAAYSVEMVVSALIALLITAGVSTISFFLHRAVKKTDDVENDVTTTRHDVHAIMKELGKVEQIAQAAHKRNDELRDDIKSIRDRVDRIAESK